MRIVSLMGIYRRVSTMDVRIMITNAWRRACSAGDVMEWVVLVSVVLTLQVKEGLIKIRN
jgi:hypothetical protein